MRHFVTGSALRASSEGWFIQTMPNLLRLFLTCLVWLGPACAGARAGADPAMPENITVAERACECGFAERSHTGAVAYHLIAVSGEAVIVRMRASERRPDQRLLDAGPLLKALPGRVEQQGNILAYHDFSKGKVRTVDFRTGVVRESGTIIGKDEALERSDRASVWLSAQSFEWLTDETIAFAPDNHDINRVELPPERSSPEPPAALLIPASLPDGRVTEPDHEAGVEAALETAIASMALKPVGDARPGLEGVFDQRVAKKAVREKTPAQGAASPIAVSGPLKAKSNPVLMPVSFEPGPAKAPIALNAPRRPAPVSLESSTPSPWTGDLLGTVRLDTNGDGQAGPKDEFIEGQLVRLTRLSTGETLEHRTAAFGQYGFSGLQPGRYELAVTFGREPNVHELELGGQTGSRRHDVLIGVASFDAGRVAAASEERPPRLRS